MYLTLHFNLYMDLYDDGLGISNIVNIILAIKPRYIVKLVKGWVMEDLTRLQQGSDYGLLSSFEYK